MTKDLRFPHWVLPSAEAITLVSSQTMKRYSVLPFSLSEGQLCVAVTRKLTLPELDELSKICAVQVEDRQVPDEIFAPLFKKLCRLTEALEQSTISGNADSYCQELLLQAAGAGASGLHIEPAVAQSRVRFQIDGELVTKQLLPRDFHETLLSWVKIHSSMDIAERRRPQDGRMMMTLEGRDVDCRVSTIPTLHGEKLVLRLLDRQGKKTDFEELGWSHQERQKIWGELTRQQGMILSTGPTGSGKTTTQYALLQRLNDERRNVVTVEDPIEYDIAGVNQMQLNEGAGTTFASALRSILRQDPDVIMVGKIRDGETATLAIRAALTGHMVFSTLHTSDGPSTPLRLLDMGVPPYLIAASLNAVVAQRLMRRLCLHCSADVAVPSEYVSILGPTMKTAQGCVYCNGKGYRGRIAAFEIMVLSSALREAVTRRASVDELRRLAQAEGMMTLRQAALNLVKRGLTTLEEACPQRPAMRSESHEEFFDKRVRCSFAVATGGLPATLRYFVGRVGAVGRGL